MRLYWVGGKPICAVASKVGEDQMLEFKRYREIDVMLSGKNKVVDTLVVGNRNMGKELNQLIFNAETVD